MPHQTFFCTAPFIEAVTRSIGDGSQPIAIPVDGSGPERTVFASAESARFRTRYLSLAPFSLYACPGWEGVLERKTVERLLRQLQGPRTRGFSWSVRFDHQPLAAVFEEMGIPCRTTTTHVVRLERGYDLAASQYSASIRNQLRKALRRGVSVRNATGDSDLRAYHELHTRMVEEREWKGFRHPYRLLEELVRVTDSVRLLVAEFEGKIIAGALLFRDASSVLYWHGASDRRYSHLFASRPILDEAARWACESGARTLDLGGSAGISTLEQFKASWGARQETNWVFRWDNPLWTGLSSLKALVRQPVTQPLFGLPWASLEEAIGPARGMVG